MWCCGLKCWNIPVIGILESLLVLRQTLTDLFWCRNWKGFLSTGIVRIGITKQVTFGQYSVEKGNSFVSSFWSKAAGNVDRSHATMSQGSEAAQVTIEMLRNLWFSLKINFKKHNILKKLHVLSHRTYLLTLATRMMDERGSLWILVWNMKKKKQILVYFEAWKNELVCYIPAQSLFLFA